MLGKESVKVSERCKIHKHDETVSSCTRLLRKPSQAKVWSAVGACRHAVRLFLNKVTASLRS